ncbi:hypothetical protein PENTCL1PPCAC_10939, partial [Pristionchus entomophagus]
MNKNHYSSPCLIRSCTTSSSPFSPLLQILSRIKLLRLLVRILLFHGSSMSCRHFTSNRPIQTRRSSVFAVNEEGRFFIGETLGCPQI